jgi:hypothetical protein
MKTINKVLMTALVALITAITAKAVTVRPLDVLESVRWGATHVITILESDLTLTNTTTFAQTLTNGTIAANTTIVPVALVVGTAFNVSAADNAADTNGYNTTTVTVGDSASATQFLTSMQINANGTNDTVRFVAAGGGTIAVTLQTIAAGLTNSAVLVPVVTNATAAFTGSITGTKSYTSANAFRFAFTGMTNEALSAYTTGRLDFYYREIKP